MRPLLEAELRQEAHDAVKKMPGGSRIRFLLQKVLWCLEQQERSVQDIELVCQRAYLNRWTLEKLITAIVPGYLEAATFTSVELDNQFIETFVAETRKNLENGFVLGPSDAAFWQGFEAGAKMMFKELHKES